MKSLFLNIPIADPNRIRLLLQNRKSRHLPAVRGACGREISFVRHKIKRDYR
jgi:hypothetical protein